jgi:RimJ/RimL family protein N-acetyltransferase
MKLIPLRIQTERLVLRCNTTEDAPLVKEAIDSSLEHLRPWMAWAYQEPSPLPVLEKRIQAFHHNFLIGRDFPLGIFNAEETRILGGTGLHPRGLPNEIEIGYWLRPDATGHGYVTESSRALVQVAFKHLDVDTIIIKCDPKNSRSAAVPQRLGFTLTGLFPTTENLPGRTQDMVWALKK